MKTAIAFGDGRLEFRIPGGRFLGVLKNRPKAGACDLNKLLVHELDKPRNRKLLSDIAACRKRALIVAPDNTRSAHLKDILPELLERLDRIRIKADVIIATGLHKKHDSRQLKELLGPGITERCRVFCHDSENLVLWKRGRTVRGVPITHNAILKDYGAVMTLGVIEPHLYAGYSGGAKTIAIGLAGEDTINATHGTRFLDDPGTRLGSVERNPFQDSLWEMVRDVNVVFSVNVVNDNDGNAAGVFCGELKDVFRRGVRLSRELSEVRGRGEADMVICGIGRPKDVNLYQASRAINYVLNVDKPVLRKGGVLIMAAELKDGSGEGLSEKRFYEELRRMGPPASFMKKTRRVGCIAGVHRAYMVAGPMMHYNIFLVTGRGGAFTKGLPFKCFPDIHSAIEEAGNIVGKHPKIYVIPKALATIARLR